MVWNGIADGTVKIPESSEQDGRFMYNVLVESHQFGGSFRDYMEYVFRPAKDLIFDRKIPAPDGDRFKGARIPVELVGADALRDGQRIKAYLGVQGERCVVIKILQTLPPKL